MEENLKHGAFSWNELITTDPAAALEFYTKLFGWNTEVMHMQGMDYTVVKFGDRAIGGLMAAPGGVPAGWKSYVTVDDIDATAKLAESLGGKICVPPTDIPNVGRFAILIDPQGAVIAAITYLKRSG
jgi:predicted enzyme related to lactoylglutathione lyase